VSHASPERLAIEQDHPSRRLDDNALRTVIQQVLDAEGACLVHLSVVLTGHDTVRRLNQSYLDHDYNTDVLSFSLRSTSAPFHMGEEATEGAPGERVADEKETTVEGEVYVDLDTAAERHDEFGASFEAEAYRYVIHGILHLAGHDDATDAGQAAMREREDRYLNAFAPVSP
jgi:rRNA maturation RNase YbeY